MIHSTFRRLLDLADALIRTPDIIMHRPGDESANSAAAVAGEEGDRGKFRKKSTRALQPLRNQRAKAHYCSTHEPRYTTQAQT